MSGTLYVIGTPIGNLEDMTLRQLRMLQEVDYIAAEDTRVTRKLLSHYDIHTPMVSYHDHSGQLVTQQLLQRIAAGETCGIVTDAGMPCISDPGEILVRCCKEQGIPVTAVPGPSAAITALAISGQETGRFTFEGFLSVTKKQRTPYHDFLRSPTQITANPDGFGRLFWRRTSRFHLSGTDETARRSLENNPRRGSASL